MQYSGKTAFGSATILFISLAILIFDASASRAIAGVPARVTQAVAREGWTVVLIEIPVPASSGKAGAAQDMPAAASIAAARSRALPKLEGAGFHLRGAYASVPWIIAEVNNEGLARLAKSADIGAVGLDQRVKAADSESFAAIGAATVRDTLPFKGAGVTIGIIDSGIETTHGDLQNAVVSQARFLSQGSDNGTNIEDDHGHGTHLAGIITGDGIVAPKGIAPLCKLAVVKALDAPSGPDSLGGWLSDITRGLDWFIENRHQWNDRLYWINMSLVFDNPQFSCPCDSASDVAGEYKLFRAILSLAEKSHMYPITPSGNNGPEGAKIEMPACFTRTIAVAATYDANVGHVFPLGGGAFSCDDFNVTVNSITCFSSRNACVDFAAPGYSIVSCGLGNGRTTMNGTSQAVAHVTGSLALMQSIKPGDTPEFLLQCLRETAVPTPDPLNAAIKYPRIDVIEASNHVRARNEADNWLLYR